MNERIFSVYMHKNKINGKIYIGATSKKPELRWANGLGYKGNKKFYEDILKYGWENFEHKIIIDNLSQEESQVLERFYIQKYKNNIYNRSIGGEPRKIELRNGNKKETKYNKSFYEKNKEKIIQKVMEYKKKNVEKYNEYQRDYYQQNQKYHDYKVQYQRNYRAKMKQLKSETEI